jgi:hypothetical protein
MACKMRIAALADRDSPLRRSDVQRGRGRTRSWPHRAWRDGKSARRRGKPETLAGKWQHSEFPAERPRFSPLGNRTSRLGVCPWLRGPLVLGSLQRACKRVYRSLDPGREPINHRYSWKPSACLAICRRAGSGMARTPLSLSQRDELPPTNEESGNPVASESVFHLWPGNLRGRCTVCRVRCRAFG